MIISSRYCHLLRDLRPSSVFKEDSMSPKKITCQILLLQLFYYFTAAVLFYVWGTIYGYKLEIKKWLFSWEAIDYTNAIGLSIAMLWLVDSLICVIFLTVIVGRSKLAWDFAITIHAINFSVVFFYSGRLPSLQWFILQVLSSLILIFLGTWSTRWNELRETFFEGLLDAPIDHNNTSSTTNNNLRPQTDNDPIELKDLEAQK